MKEGRLSNGLTIFSFLESHGYGPLIEEMKLVLRDPMRMFDEHEWITKLKQDRDPQELHVMMRQKCCLSQVIHMAYPPTCGLLYISYILFLIL